MSTLSTIGRGTTIRGSIRGDGDLDIHGHVEGAVSVEGELVIGETALIKSDISGRRVTVRGAVAGNVSAEELLVLEAGARVAGDLGAPQIGIRPGALVRGNVATGAPLPAGGISTARPRVQAPAQTARTAPTREPVRAPSPAPAVVRPVAPVARPPQAAPPRSIAQPSAPHAAPASQPHAPASPPRSSAPVADGPARSPAPSSSAAAEAAGPPPPVVPSIPKGAKASIKRKATR